MAATITDIARACGVSIATVSAVVNDKGRISESTRTRVLNTVRKMAYDAQAHKPAVRGVRTGTVGLVLPVMSHEAGDFYYRAITAAHTAAGNHALDSKVITEDELRPRLTDTFHRGRAQLGCDQLVFFCPSDAWQEFLPALRAWNIPAAVIRRNAAHTGITYLQNDDYAGMRLAVGHLADRGHRNIAMLRMDNDTSDALGRMRAYRDVLRERELCTDERLTIYGNGFKTDLVARLRELKAAGLTVTAIATYGDHLAAWAARRLLEAGMRIPQDIALTGFDNDVVSRQFYPSITTVDIPVEKMVAAAVNAVVGYRPEMREIKQVLSFAEELVVRKSTGTLKNA